MERSDQFNVKNLALEFCSSSSVHGVQYFGDRNRTCCEKIWWIVVFLLSLGGCSFVIYKTYQKWDQTPVIVSFAERSTPISHIPFPAVTICSDVKASMGHFNLSREFEEAIETVITETFYNGTVEASDHFLAMLQLCSRVYRIIFAEITPDLPNKTTEQSYGSLIREMWSTTYKSIGLCIMNYLEYECTELFVETMTDEGICYTFNGLAVNELLRTEVLPIDVTYSAGTTSSPHWTLENGYSTQANLSTYPWRSFAAGSTSGFSVLLRSDDTNHEIRCGGPAQGFKVLLHSPADYPQMTKKFVHIPSDQQTSIAVKPQIITTSAGLQDYNPERRQCYFNRERYLQFFRVYTQDNCELECLTNFTLHYCGCVRFSMPRTNQTPVCETNQNRCMLDAEDLLLHMDSLSHENSQWNFRSECSCLPACTSMHYEIEISHMKLNWLNQKQRRDNARKFQIGQLVIYYKEAQFMTSRRSELYGWTDFLANCGGLLGLFMGVSLLSIVELLYFCTVRPVIMWKSGRNRICSVQQDPSSKIRKENGIYSVDVESLLTVNVEGKTNYVVAWPPNSGGDSLDLLPESSP